MYQEVSGRGITAADTTQSEVDAHYDQVKAIFDVPESSRIYFVIACFALKIQHCLSWVDCDRQ